MIEVYRIESAENATVLERLLNKFHDKVVGLRYNRVWSIQNLAVASKQPYNNLVLAAWDEDKGDYTGYLWAAVNPNGEVFIHQCYSETPATGKALERTLDNYCARVGSHTIDCLVTLQQGEGMQLIQSVRRFDYLAKQHGFVPMSVWLTRPVNRGH